MGIWRLVLQEMRYRKLDAVLGVFAVVVAAACLVAVMTLLRGHELRLTELTKAQEADTQTRMAVAEDDYRKITKKLGYNVLILSKDQDLGAFYADGHASALMPESYVDALANQKVMSIRHLLPTLHEKMTWKEQADQPLVLVGVRGEATLAHRPPRESMLDPVQPGEMRIGYLLHKNRGLAAGDTVTLMGRSFEISDIQPERGNADDITAWIHLDTAQEMLERKGQVNSIMALSCNCVGLAIEGIRKELREIVPDTQVIELASQAEVRSLARTRVSELSEDTLQGEQEHHARLHAAREALATWLAPLVVVGAIIWVGLLALGNVRERRTEIGIWRALGLRSTQVLAIFMIKAVIVGFAGAVAGWCVGFILGAAWGNAEGVLAGDLHLSAFLDAPLLLGVLVCAPLLAALASWLPAMIAAQQDPADVLRQE